MLSSISAPRRDPTAPTRPPCEVADIFRRYGAAYRAAHALPVTHRRIMSALEHCRTAVLGGHVDECDLCGTLRIAYNSCRNRHCPKCQGAAREQWVAAREAQLLPIEYFHVVFTVPEELFELLHFHQRLVLNLLFRTAAETLLQFGQRHLGGELGITAVLHTWGQTLAEHPHLHCIVTGGALAANGATFTRCPAGYLFPVKALSVVFRAKFCRALERAFSRGLLPQGRPAQITSAPCFQAYLRRLAQQPWVVYAKRPFAGPAGVIRYLGRYTHRVAISNHRLLSIADGQVTFTYQDYRGGGRQKVLTLSAAEFIRRFLLHVLPPGFVRIRHYGVLANGRRAKLECCQALLLPRNSALDRETGPAPASSPLRLTAVACPCCGTGRMVRRLVLPPEAGVPLALAESTLAGLNPHRPPPETF